MRDFIKAMDELPWIVKIILCIPALDIIWGVYRIIKGINTQNTLMLVIGIIWIVPGSFVCWIIDLLTTVFSGRPTLLA